MESGEIGTCPVGILLVMWLNEMLFTIRKVKVKALLFIGQGFTQHGVLDCLKGYIYPPFYLKQG